MKKLKYIVFTLVALLFINVTSVSAEIITDDNTDSITAASESEVVTYERKEEDNYGVKKHWNITNDNILNVKSTPLVDASQKVYDFAGVLTSEEIEKLKKKINVVEREINMAVVIVTYDNLGSEGRIQTFADDFYDYNDFGINNEYYSGILAIRNISTPRYYYVGTTGQAQLYFPQDRIDNILDSMYFGMHNDYYFNGFMDFLTAIENNYAKGLPDKYKDVTMDKNGYIYDQFGNRTTFESGRYDFPFSTAIGISSLVTLITILRMRSKNKMVKKLTDANEYIDSESMAIRVSNDKFVSSHTSSYTVSSSSGSGGGGFSGGHSSSSGSSHGGGGRSC